MPREAVRTASHRRRAFFRCGAARRGALSCVVLRLRRRYARERRTLQKKNDGQRTLPIIALRRS